MPTSIDELHIEETPEASYTRRPYCTPDHDHYGTGVGAFKAEGWTYHPHPAKGDRESVTRKVFCLMDFRLFNGNLDAQFSTGCSLASYKVF